MFKRVLFTIFVVCLFMPIVAGAEVSIIVNDQVLEVPEEIFVINGTTQVPLRTIIEAFSARVNWDGQKKIVTVDYNNARLELFIDKYNAKVNGKDKKLRESPQIINNKTYVPLRFISEEFKAEVDYDHESRIIYINIEKDWQVAKPLAFDEVNKKIYTYTQGNDFKTKEALVRSLTVLDQKSGNIIKIYNDLLSEENTLVIHNNNFYQYRFIPKNQSFGITKQNLVDIKNIEVLNYPTSKEEKDIRLIGVVNNTLYINDQGNIKTLNLASNQQMLIYAGQAEDVHVSQEEIILFDEDKIIKVSLDGTKREKVVSQISKNYSSGLDNWQMRVVGNQIYYINNEKLYRIDINREGNPEVVANLDMNISVKTTESIREGRIAELITNFLPTDNDIYLSKSNESSLGVEKDINTENLNQDQLKTYRSYTQILYKQGMSKDIIFNQKEDDYKFGTHGSVFPLMKYLHKQGDYIYLLNRYLGETTYYRFNVKTKTLAPLAYNIKKFEYNN